MGLEPTAFGAFIPKTLQYVRSSFDGHGINWQRTTRYHCANRPQNVDIKVVMPPCKGVKVLGCYDTYIALTNTAELSPNESAASFVLRGVGSDLRGLVQLQIPEIEQMGTRVICEDARMGVMVAFCYST